MTRKKWLLITCGAVVVLAAGMFLARGWIRGHFMPAYVNHFYRSGVERTFNEQFSEVNTQLAGLGFNQPTLSPAKCDASEAVEFSGFSESVSCIKGQTRILSRISGQFFQAWQKNSPALERFLLSHGWQKQWDARQPIEGIFDKPHSQGTGVVYGKSLGKLNCNLSITYMASALTQTVAGEYCGRRIAFFGGYPY